MATHAYYNEIEPAAAHILECLIKDGVIADGVVDRRSIVDVEPKDVAGFRQAHFFAGGGLWSVAARMAGWQDQRPLWTGSCPCQPFSVAGKGLGEDDPRHLWPHFFRLINAVRPPVVVGEQVSGAAGFRWFDGVADDLEGADYTVEAFNLSACSVDAPHIRKRLYWWALEHAARERRGEGRPEHEFRSGRPATSGAGSAHLADATGWEQWRLREPREGSGRGELPDRGHGGDASFSSPLVNTDRSGRGELRGAEPVPAQLAGAQRASSNAFDVADAGRRGRGGRAQEPVGSAQRGVAAERVGGDMADADSAARQQVSRSASRDEETHGRTRWDRSQPHGDHRSASYGEGGDVADADGAEPGRGQFRLQPLGGSHRGDAPEQERASFWSDYEWRTGADGKARRVKPGVRLLVDGLPNRVSALRIAGNAIVAPLAAQVLEALMESLP